MFNGCSISFRWTIVRFSATFRFPPLLFPFSFPISLVTCPISHFPFPISYFLFPISYFLFPISHFPLPLPMARPGGMRGAIEYGQPLAGSAVLEARSRNCRIRSRICFREAKYAAIAPSAGPPLVHCFSKPF